MSENRVVRRASYGPTSPVVGARGSRTRARIIEETLRLFEEQGFHGTSVDDIARAAGVSRATLYQYFESKDKLFVELLDECGTALMRVVRRIGPLGPTALGFDNLHWWLGEWAWVYDKYATMFVQWATVDSPETTVSNLVYGFRRAYDKRIAERLLSSGIEGIDPAATATVMATVVHRFNYFRHLGLAGSAPTDELIDNLAVVMQLMLFPRTPTDAFAQLRRGPSRPPASASASAATASAAAAVAVQELPVATRVNRLDELSPRAAATVRGLLDAGIRCFAQRGYHQSSIDDIVAEAGFARGTFYKYFGEKLDLLAALSDEATAEIARLDRTLEAVTIDQGKPPELRQWLAGFITFHSRYYGVTRTWIEGTPLDARLTSVRDRIGASMHRALRQVLEQVERPYPLDLNIAGTVFFALLERLPDIGATLMPEITFDAFVDLMSSLIERGLLNGRPIGRQPDPSVVPAG